MGLGNWKWLVAFSAVGLWGCGGELPPNTGLCGAGTVLDGDTCVVSGLSPCPTGLVLVGNECKRLLACGAGTTEQSGLCVAQSAGPGTTCGVGTALSGTECLPNLQTVCGTDTTGAAGTCVSALRCGTGTTRVGNECTANPANLSCGAGTTLSGSQCVGTLSCGTGTALLSNACVVNLSTVCSTDTTGAGGNRCVSSLSCGSGTTRTGNQCTAQTTSTVTCGAGTVLQGTTCVVAPTTGPISTFLGLTTNARAAFHPASYSGYSEDRRFVVTNLSQGNADAWANIEAAMVGSGRALHMNNYSTLNLSAAATYLTVRNDTTLNGAGARVCGALVGHGTPGTGATIAVNVFDWAGGNATPVACGYQGTVKLERADDLSTGATRTKATLNVVLSDGTTLSDYIAWF